MFHSKGTLCETRGEVRNIGNDGKIALFVATYLNKFTNREEYLVSRYSLPRH